MMKQENRDLTDPTWPEPKSITVPPSKAQSELNNWIIRGISSESVYGGGG